jgi:hypothetical protein
VRMGQNQAAADYGVEGNVGPANDDQKRWVTTDHFRTSQAAGLRRDELRWYRRIERIK